MKYYSYHKETGEYLGAGDAEKDPIDGIDLLPANATFLKPPAAKKGEVLIFFQEKWKKTVDLRGKLYYDKNGEEYTISKIGEEFPEWGLEELPPELKLKFAASSAIKAIDAASDKYSQMFMPVSLYRLKEYELVASHAGKAMSKPDEAPDWLKLDAQLAGLTVPQYCGMALQKADASYDFLLNVVRKFRHSAKAQISKLQSVEEIEHAMILLKNQAEEEFKKLMAK